MNGNPNDIFDQIENLKVEKTEKTEAVWVEKGSCYGNCYFSLRRCGIYGTPFASIVPLYVCSNCGTMSCTLFNICPECKITMTNGKKEGDKE